MLGIKIDVLLYLLGKCSTKEKRVKINLGNSLLIIV